MKARFRLIAIALLMIGALAGSSCSGGGEDAAGGDPPSNWDSMAWDEGHWQ